MSKFDIGRKIVDVMIKERALKFFELGYEIEYHEGDVDKTGNYTICSEDTLVAENGRYIFIFNLESKCVVVQDAHDSQQFYGLPTIFITANLLDAILEVVVLLGWR